MHELAVAVDAAAASDRLVSGNGEVHDSSRSKDHETLNPPLQNLLEPHWGRIGALRVPPRSPGLSAGQPPTSPCMLQVPVSHQ